MCSEDGHKVMINDQFMCGFSFKYFNCWLIANRCFAGFFHSQEEPSALIQCEGGPCAIIAPVQAFILKAIITDQSLLQENLWRRVNIIL